MDIKTELTTALETLVGVYQTVVANPKPTYSLDGQSVSWGEYAKMLRAEIEALTGTLAAFDPVELRSSIL